MIFSPVERPPESTYMSQKTEPVDLDPSQAADLAALERSAIEGDLAADPAAAEPAAPRLSIAEELAALVTMTTKMLAPAFPSLARIYTPDTINTATAAIGAVCEKHGWLADGLMGEYAEELTAAVILLPLAATTYQGIKADIADRKKADEKAQEEADQERRASRAAAANPFATQPAA